MNGRSGEFLLVGGLIGFLVALAWWSPIDDRPVLIVIDGGAQ